MVSVILSLTTIPERVGTLNRVLDSLVAQRGVAFEVHVNVQEGTVINERHPDPRVKYFDVPNEGPISKLLGTLRRVTDPAQRLVIVDDDHLYHPAMLAVYAEYLAHPMFERAALGFQGLIFNRTADRFDCILTLPPGTHQPVEYLQGFKSACYRRDHFPVAFTEGWAHTHWADDWTLGSWCGAAGIPSVVVSYREETDLTPRAISFPVVAEIPHEANGCADHREQDGGVYASDRAFLNGPLGAYAKAIPLVSLQEPRARGAAFALPHLT